MRLRVLVSCLGALAALILASALSLARADVPPAAAHGHRVVRVLLPSRGTGTLELAGSRRRSIHGRPTLRADASVWADDTLVITTHRELVREPIGGRRGTLDRWELRSADPRGVDCAVARLPGEILHGTVAEVRRQGMMADVGIDVDDRDEELLPGDVLAVSIETDGRPVNAFAVVLPPSRAPSR